MDIALWIAQGILTIKLLTSAITHSLGSAKPAMQSSMQKWGRSSRVLHPVIAILLFIGSLGLVLPGLLWRSFTLTIYSAGFLAVLLILSIVFHVKTREKPNIVVSVILCLIAVFVAVGRWMPVQ